MMLDRIVSQRNACIEKINESDHIDENDKMLFRDLINNAANGTNGLSPENKLQNVSETVFSMVMLAILDKCSKPTETPTKIGSLCKMICDCKWALCVVVGFVCLVLALRPELSSMILSLSGKG